MTRSAIAVVLGVCLAVLHGCDLLSASPEPSFEGTLLPLPPGNQWTMVRVPVLQPHEKAEQADTSRLRVLSEVQIDGRTYFALHGLLGGRAMLLREDENGHVYRRQNGDDVLWLDASVQGDSTYKYNSFNVHVSSIDAVTTPAGTFRDCLGFSFNIPEMVDDERTFILKPGIGFVRRGGAWIGRRDLASYHVHRD